MNIEEKGKWKLTGKVLKEEKWVGAKAAACFRQDR
jgi:hypothetical protein